MENSVFQLDLVLLRFTAVASYSFYCPSWRSTANSSSATLSCTCFWIFLPSGIQSGEETDVGRQRLNRALESLLTFTRLVFRAKQGAWHKQIQLTKGDFPSIRTTNSVRLILGSKYSIDNPTLSHEQLCENHIKRAHLLWGLKQVLGSNMIHLRTNLTHRRQLSLTEGESDFLPLPVFFSEWVQRSPT